MNSRIESLQLGNTLAIIYNQKENIIAFTSEEIKREAEKTGYKVILQDIKKIEEVQAEKRIIIIEREIEESSELLIREGFSELPEPYPQAYSIRKRDFGGYTTWYIIGDDRNGAMYGGLSFAWAFLQAKGLEAMVDCYKKPYILNRGIKFNIPLDARTPSYSDSGDSAQKNILNMWDLSFWKEFLDEMARDHYNTLSLWNLNPFPSMVKVPEYPEVALNDVKKTTTLLNANLEGRDMSTAESLANLVTLKVMSIDEKIRFWQEVMQYAYDRGIDIYIFTWNTFVYGTESSGYGFTTLVEDIKTQDYFRKSVSTLIKTYPLLKGIGITAGENMSRNPDADEQWLYNTYGEGINDALKANANRSFSLIHRIQYANIKLALSTFSKINPRCSVACSFKYSQAHMYSSTSPYYIHKNDDHYFNDIGEHKTWLTVRDDDYYMLRWGDPKFVKEYIKNIPNCNLHGFYMGPDGYTWGREYISNSPDCPNELVIKKRWYSFLLWGRIAFDPDISEGEFIRVIAAKYPEANAEKLYNAWCRASRIIPTVNRFHNGGCQLDFQWYPEACTGYRGFHDINSFINASPQFGEGLVSIPQYAESILNNTPVVGTTPVEIATYLESISGEALELIKDMTVIKDKKLRAVVEDIKAMSYMGLYYSKKISGATNKHLAVSQFNSDKKHQYRIAAVLDLKKASDYWRVYAELVSRLYVPQTLTRLIDVKNAHRDVDVVRLQSDVDNDIVLAEKCI